MRRFKVLLSARRVAVYLKALVILWRDPRTPRPVRWLAVAVLAYALSPIDLIPDAVPVLGLVDDLILVPLGIALVMKFTPYEIRREAMARAETNPLSLPKWRAGAWIVVGLWALLLAAGLGLAIRWSGG